VAVQALLTIVGRAAIQGATPAAIFEAAAQGSGKTLQMHCVSIIATGRAAGVMTFPMAKGEPNEEELEKFLAACALAGQQIVPFDNVKGTLGGPALEKCLTAEEDVLMRILGQSERRLVPWIAVMMVTGNNMTMTDDVSQRCMLSRLESQREDPRSRPETSFRHPDLLRYVREHRAALLCDALTVLRAFVVATPEERRAAGCGTWGSYAAWARLIAPAIKYAGGPNMLDARPHGGDGQDDEASAHTALMRGWPDGDPIKASDLVSRLFEHEYDIKTGKAPPDGADEMRSALRLLTRTPETRAPNGVSVGKALAGMRGKWREGLKISGVRDRKGTTHWTVERQPSAPAAASAPDPDDDGR
jgi:hypothetical protein